MSSRPGFDSAGLAIGSVTGVRWWDLGNGTLRGAWADWAPGENTARCLRSGGLIWREPPHGEVPDERCSCGYWAYWQQSAAPEVGGGHPVLGVIDGYGPVLIGDLGFRAAKTRIIALCLMFKIMVPLKQPDPPSRLWTPPEGMFHLGPRGMDTYQAMTGHQPATMAEDPEALLHAQNLLEQAYDVPVYTSPAAMLLRHPPTTDYLPKRRDDLVEVAAGAFDSFWLRVRYPRRQPEGTQT